MVSVDETLEKTKPLENPEEIKLWARPATLALDVWSSYPETRPADAFVLYVPVHLQDSPRGSPVRTALRLLPFVNATLAPAGRQQSRLVG